MNCRLLWRNMGLKTPSTKWLLDVSLKVGDCRRTYGYLYMYKAKCAAHSQFIDVGVPSEGLFRSSEMQVYHRTTQSLQSNRWWRLNIAYWKAKVVIMTQLCRHWQHWRLSLWQLSVFSVSANVTVLFAFKYGGRSDMNVFISKQGPGDQWHMDFVHENAVTIKSISCNYFFLQGTRWWRNYRRFVEIQFVIKFKWIFM